MEQKFSLCPENMKNLPFDKYENDFTFYVNGNPYKTSRIVADILSPSIRRMHYLDSAINEFSININSNSKEDGNTDYFKDFLQLATFNNSIIDQTRQKFYIEYFYQIGNIDAYFQLQPTYIESLSVENVIERLLEISKFIIKTETETISMPSIIDQLIKFAASHFQEIDKEMKRLPLSMIENIINNESLVLSDEDSLLVFILSLYKDDNSASNLFEYVLFKNISDEIVEKFVNEFSIEFINNSIWKSICKRLIKSQSKSDINEERRYKMKYQVYHYKGGNEFQGIMRYLTNKTGGNIHDNQTIKITSNSINGSYHPKNLVDYEKTNYYHSLDNGDAFVCFDFKDKFVDLESYSIQSPNYDQNGIHLKNWAIEVSNDDEHWCEVDRRENDSTLKGQNFKANFVLKNPQNKFFRYIRLRQTGNSWWYSNNHNYMGFCFIEFYGKLQDPSK